MKMRNKLLATSLMLVVSILMMSTASFAWFTISTAPEITDLTTTVVVNENLEIALAKGETDQATPTLPAASAINTTGNNYTWGNIINLNGFVADKMLDGTTDVGEDGNEYEAIDKTLRPMQLSLANGSNLPTGDAENPAPSVNTFQYPTYGNDGRPNDFANIAYSTKAHPFGNLTGETVVEGDAAKIYGYYMDVWFRSNEGGTLKLVPAAAVDGEEGLVGVERSDEGDLGNGSKITTTNKILADNIRVAVQVIGYGSQLYGEAAATTAYTTATAAGKNSNLTNVITELTTNVITPEADATEFVNTFSGDVTTLAPNEAQLVRFYIYLDGTNVTNEAASLTGTLVTGALNLQFAIEGVTDSMDGQPIAPAEPSEP